MPKAPRAKPPPQKQKSKPEATTQGSESNIRGLLPSGIIDITMKIGRYIAFVVMGFALLCGTFAALPIAQPVQAQELSAEERARLQAEYDKLQVEIAQWQKVLD